MCPMRNEGAEGTVSIRRNGRWERCMRTESTVTTMRTMCTGTTSRGHTVVGAGGR